ncbi:hypothetical protein D1007_48612 [Hordeum vulgare]|nr:hypothetical protein D1007_48612 [Hordeum vulgare]
MIFTMCIKDLKMCENLAVNDTLSMALELFNLADKCAKAKEGLLFTHENPDDVPEDTNAKDKEVKCKGPAVLAAKPKQKRGCEESAPEKERHPL